MTSYKIGVISLGCSKNRVDTEYMLGLLEAGGHMITNRPEAAEVLIINTCGFIESAKQESINTILEYSSYKTKGCCKTLVVTGCLSERYRRELPMEIPEVDIWLGVHEYEQLPGLLDDHILTPPPYERKLTTPPHRAYLRIADGCNNGCAYCAIPLIRGPLSSVPMPVLLDEACRLLDQGVSELTLIAQDTSGYGLDIYGTPMLLPLLDSLSKLQGLRWLRVLYTYPDTVTPELIRGMADNEKVCNYLDMPLQHVSDDMLQRMRRRGNRMHIEKILTYIRSHAPDFTLRTTMMVGFPGETDAHFRDMLQFLEQYQFDRLGAFAFSPEEDTSAYSMSGQVEDHIKQERLDELMRLQRGISLARNTLRIGAETEVLIEEAETPYSYCRSRAEAPEVDGYILLPYQKSHCPGAYVFAKLAQALDYDMIGEEL